MTSAAPTPAIVLVTGSSRGIGRALAARFHAEGAHVILHGRDEAALRRVADGLSADGRVSWLAADLRDAAQIDRLFGEIAERFGRLDVLVNNAGVTLTGSFAAQSPEALRHLLDINLRAPLLCTRAAFRLMKSAGRGTVINISSNVAAVPLPLLAAYSSTKAALEALTDSLRQELMDAGIGMFLIAPGAVDTDIVKSHTPEFEARYDGAIERLAPETIADAAIGCWQLARHAHLKQIVLEHFPARSQGA
jgi:NAD(P)-dependent dehydrogenase (short-subunit alcohol dehydrogenase family)